MDDAGGEPPGMRVGTLNDRHGEADAATPTAAPVAVDAPPLIVDLDNTLIRSDVLVESFLTLAGSDRPGAWSALQALPKGKAAFKAAIADRAALDVVTLPYDRDVLALVAAVRAEGRKVLLVSASDARYVTAIAAHLGLFDEAWGSDGQVNLGGPNKARALVARFGERGFDYIGDAPADAAVWAVARNGYVKAPSHGLIRTLRAQGLALEPVGVRTPRRMAFLKALRPHQWLKNALVFAPPLAGHALTLPMLLASVAAFVSYSLCASSVYLLNDLLDLKSDREHPRKRLRPFASGDAPVLQGALLAPLLLVVAVGVGLWLPPRFLMVLAGYYGLTLAYSLGLKRLVMIDVVTLACLYGARLLAGSAATGVPLSNWLEALAIFLFLSLALVKRTAELVDRIAAGQGDPTGRGYRLSDLPMVQAMAAAAGFVAVLVLALYLNSADVRALYHFSNRLWLICVVVLYWVSRMLMKAHRGEMHDDPVVFAVRDRLSQVCGALCAVVVAFSL